MTFQWYYLGQYQNILFYYSLAQNRHKNYNFVWMDKVTSYSLGYSNTKPLNYLGSLQDIFI